jgi:hypothetical protein
VYLMSMYCLYSFPKEFRGKSTDTAPSTYVVVNGIAGPVAGKCCSVQIRSFPSWLEWYTARSDIPVSSRYRHRTSHSWFSDPYFKDFRSTCTLRQIRFQSSAASPNAIVAKDVREKLRCKVGEDSLSGAVFDDDGDAVKKLSLLVIVKSEEGSSGSSGVDVVDCFQSTDPK